MRRGFPSLALGLGGNGIISNVAIHSERTVRLDHNRTDLMIGLLMQTLYMSRRGFKSNLKKYREHLYQYLNNSGKKSI